MQSFRMLKEVVHTESLGFKGLNNVQFHTEIHLVNSVAFIDIEDVAVEVILFFSILFLGWSETESLGT
jgi:hypothetical protein